MGFLSQCQTNLLLLIGISFAVAVIYYALPWHWRLHWVLSFSLVFYVACSGWMTIALLTSVGWTWYCAWQMNVQGTKAQRGWLVAGVVPLVLLLAFFKYNGFFLEDFQRILGKVGLGFAGNGGKILMPLGISYYTFKNISYLADVFQGIIPAEKKIVRYSTYALLFSQITAGPIDRYSNWSTVFEEGKPHYQSRLVEQGLNAICLGLFMKLVIANRLAAYTGEVFSQPNSFPGLALWVAAFFYAIQLYCDFAGYSYIAIGLTKILSLPCCENFQRPYWAEDIREFWARWHISLSTWLRDYVYIPLGGSRCSKWRKNLNVMVTFLVSGLWHGVGLNYVIWGIWHGVLNVMTPKRGEATINNKSIVRRGLHVVKVGLNFLLVTLGWVFFASPNCRSALQFLKGMFCRFSCSGNALQKTILPFTHDNTCLAFFLTALFFIAIYTLYEWNAEQKWVPSRPAFSFCWKVFLLVGVELFGQFNGGFIYANF